MQPPDANNPRFSIVFPARNEDQRIQKTLKTYAQFFEQQRVTEIEMIVVANNCTDRTEEVVREMSKGIPYIRLISHGQPGKGRAILEGFRQSRAETVLFCDADGSTDPSDVLRLLQLASKGEWDCAIGSRWLPQSNVPIPQPLRRRIASRMFNLAVRIILGLPFKDTQCGAKAFNRRALEVVVQKVTSEGYQFDCDVLWQLKKAGLRVVEVPVTWRDSGGSGIRVGRDGTKMLTSLFKIRFKS